MTGGTYAGDTGLTYGTDTGGSYGYVQTEKRIDLFEPGAVGPSDSTTALLSVDINLEHSALSDMTVSLPPFEGLTQDRYSGGELHYSIEGRLIFAAEINSVSVEDDRTVTISGTAVEGQPLIRDDHSVSFEETRTVDAIRLFLEALLPYEPVVRPPPLRPLDNQLVQRMDAAGDWFATLTAGEDIDDETPSIARDFPGDFIFYPDYVPTLHPTSPIQVLDDGLTLTQTAVFVEAEDGQTNADLRHGPNVSNNGFINLKDEGEELTVEFAFAHDIPPGWFEVAVRARVAQAHPEPFDRMEFSLDGQTLVSKHTADILPFGDIYRWVVLDISYDNTLSAADVAAGDDPHEFTVEKIEGDDWAYIDCFAFFDNRFPFGGPLGEQVDENNALSTPHLYPEFLPVVFDRPAVGADLSHVDWTVDYDEPATNGAPALIVPKTDQVEVGGDVYDSTTTTLIERVDIPDNETVITVYGVAYLASYNDDSRTKTPTENTEVQVLEAAEMRIDGNEVSVIADKREFNGDALSILQDLHTHANRRFVLETGVGRPEDAQFTSFLPTDESLTRGTADQWIVTNRNRDVTNDGMTNTVHVEGARAPDGTYYRGIAEDTAAIARLNAETPDSDDGVRSVFLEDRNLTSDNDCLSKARSELRERSRLQIGGDIEIAPALPPAGYPYNIEAFDETALDSDDVGYGQNYGQLYGVGSIGVTTALETTSYSESPGDASTSLSFERPSGLFRAFEEIATGNLQEQPHPGRDDIPTVSISSAFPTPPDEEEPPPEDDEDEEPSDPADPVAVLNYSPTNPDVGETVTFDAFDSFDEDGTLVSFTWDFGDATAGNGEEVTHTYDTADEYTVTLTVEDDDGNFDIDSEPITIGSGGTNEAIAFLDSNDPLSDADYRVGGSAGSGTHGGQHVDRPANMPTKADADFVVTTNSGLRNALMSGPNNIIYIDDDINIAPFDDVNVPRGTKLVGGFCDPDIPGRGPKLHNHNVAPYNRRHLVADQPIEVWGVSFEGPISRYDTLEEKHFDPRDKPGSESDYYVSALWCYPEPTAGETLIHGCEFRGWHVAGLEAGERTTPSNLRITRSTFENNAMETLGYGVEQWNGHMDIDLCYFNFNRHGISGFGYPTESYEVRDTMVGPDVISHTFDMHGLNQNLNTDDHTAGKFVDVFNCTFPWTHTDVYRGQGQEGVNIRGYPEETVEIHDNHFYHEHPPAGDGPGTEGDPWQQENIAENHFVRVNASGNNLGTRLESGKGCPLNAPVKPQ